MTPCKNGHTSGRYSNGNCKECLKEREHLKRLNPEWNAQKIKKECERYWKNRQKKLDYDRQYRKQFKEEISKRRKELYNSKPHHYTERNARRRARQKQATPKWADVNEIREYYSLARKMSKLRGVTMSVDHIVPLMSDKVCGLHCPANLQIIPKDVNASKGHRWWPDMFESE